jgi:hypothetical protein
LSRMILPLEEAFQPVSLSAFQLISGGMTNQSQNGSTSSTVQ